jgi:hypothetical protein
MTKFASWVNVGDQLAQGPSSESVPLETDETHAGMTPYSEARSSARIVVRVTA